MVNQERLVNEFMELVRVDSESRIERQLADILTQKLTALGLSVTEDNAGNHIGGNAGNLIAVLPGDPTIPAILFSAHIDHVMPGKGIQPVIKNEVIYSSGDTILGADDKAGIVAILEMLRVVGERKMMHGSIEVVFTVAEEVGLQGSRYFEYSNVSANMGYVLDADGKPGTIIVSAPSQDKIKATIYGKAAHAGMNPELGVNAIQAAASAISNMRLGRIDQETTANIGVIAGGRATNIIPDEVEILGEARSRTIMKLEQQSSHMVAELRQAVGEYGAKLEVMVSREYDAFVLAPENQVVQLALQSAKHVGLKTELVPSGGGSDANYFNNNGIATANLAVGMVDVHTTHEHIAIEDLVNVSRLLVSIIEQSAKLRQ